MSMVIIKGARLKAQGARDITGVLKYNTQLRKHWKAFIYHGVHGEHGGRVVFIFFSPCSPSPSW